MLTKEHLKTVQSEGNAAIRALVEANTDDKSTLFILENLGRLPTDFDTSWVLNLLSRDNRKIRLNAVKTLGKAKSEGEIATLVDIAKHDLCTEVRREAASALGRLRSQHAISGLSDLLHDRDPKIVSQAIRGLLVFKGEQVFDPFGGSGTFGRVTQFVELEQFNGGTS